jgi:phosphatidylserine/phosphatidylglycerophosphate/cardiolipin synthase-like enzyme
MGLPLQPDLTPWSASQRRLLLILLLVFGVIVLGVFAQARREPPRLLGSHGRPGSADYHTSALRLIAGARRHVSVVLYVARLDGDGPVMHLIQALGEAARRGVVVRVVLDRGRDWRSGEPDPKHLEVAERLRRGGVRVVLDEDGRTTHAKVLVVDDRRVVVGSHNWTRSALTTNREWSLLIDDPAIAAQIQAELATLPGW